MVLNLVVPATTSSRRIHDLEAFIGFSVLNDNLSCDLCPDLHDQAEVDGWEEFSVEFIMIWTDCAECNGRMPESPSNPVCSGMRAGLVELDSLSWCESNRDEFETEGATHRHNAPGAAHELAELLRAAAAYAAGGMKALADLKQRNSAGAVRLLEQLK